MFLMYKGSISKTCFKIFRNLKQDLQDKPMNMCILIFGKQVENFYFKDTILSFYQTHVQKLLSHKH